MKIGAATFKVTEVLDYRPDQGTGFVNLAPAALLNYDDVPSTQLIQPGSRVTYAALFAGPGARDYLGEEVTIGIHMRQAGALAQAAGAVGSLVAAALLHDIGHLLGEDEDEDEDRHGEAGANWLSQWFGAAVTEPVRLHVPAKRYLCAADAEYFGLLSAESVRTLSLQGGPMTAAEVAAFEALPFSRDAAAVRRWDDQAKDPAVTAPRFAHFVPLLAALVRS